METSAEMRREMSSSENWLFSFQLYNKHQEIGEKIGIYKGEIWQK